ncbi:MULTISPECIES: phage tail protein [Mycetohabitans]|uniref:phage tail protein n=1 Tax=Mycetohabitans TaxID=2571159 RepID=UPI001F390799|nr:phage tail protein [Mycetohabitans sp. B3]MCF2135170.1 phage tail protein [Mycetohabitans sp. B3]
MLMSLDQFVFSLSSAPFHELQRRRTWKHRTSSRVGARDARQFTGTGEDTITLNGLVAPEMIGTIASIRELAAMAHTGDAYALVDGAGHVYGAYVIAALDETQTYHAADGTPRKIEFRLTLERVDDDALRVQRGWTTRQLGRF